jgi:peroxiredoxin
MTNPAKPAYRFWLVVLSIFAVLATFQIVFLTIQNRALKHALSGPQTGKTPDFLKPGDQAQAFNGIDANGQTTRIAYDDADYLILITSTSCPWCARTMPIWKDIADKAKGKPLRVVAVAIDGKGELPAYIQKNGINFDVVNFAEPSTQSSYKAFSTPQTIFIKRGGRVEKTWQGLLTEKTENEVTKLFL